MPNLTHIENLNKPGEAYCKIDDPDLPFWWVSVERYFRIMAEAVHATTPRPNDYCDKCHHHWVVLCKNVEFQAQKSTQPFVGVPPFHCPYDETSRVGVRVWGEHGADVYNKGD